MSGNSVFSSKLICMRVTRFNSVVLIRSIFELLFDMGEVIVKKYTSHNEKHGPMCTL